jgi:hypothetical protein
MKWLKDWIEEETWRAARPLTRVLRLQRTELRIMMLCRFTEEGPKAIDRLPINEILAIRQIVGRNWFDTQIVLCDEGHAINDPFRTIVR